MLPRRTRGDGATSVLEDCSHRFGDVLDELLIEELQGTSARHARVGVLDLDRQGLELETATVDQYCTELPDVLRSVVNRLKTAAVDPAQRLIAERALFHLYRSSKRKAS